MDLAVRIEHLQRDVETVGGRGPRGDGLEVDRRGLAATAGEVEGDEGRGVRDEGVLREGHAHLEAPYLARGPGSRREADDGIGPHGAQAAGGACGEGNRGEAAPMPQAVVERPQQVPQPRERT